MQTFQLQGTLTGNHLTYSRENIVTEMDITNDKMEGKSSNGAQFSLTKKK